MAFQKIRWEPETGFSWTIWRRCFLWMPQSSQTKENIKESQTKTHVVVVILRSEIAEILAKKTRAIKSLQWKSVNHQSSMKTPLSKEDLLNCQLSTSKKWWEIRFALKHTSSLVVYFFRPISQALIPRFWDYFPIISLNIKQHNISIVSCHFHPAVAEFLGVS